MKALSIQQPWAELILRGLKDVENRSWATKYTGPLLIHASRRANKEALAKYGFSNGLPGGQLVGVVDVVGTTRDRASSWHDRGQWGWYLANPRRFREPIRYEGRVSLMNVPDRVVKGALRSATADPIRPLDPSPGNAPVPTSLRIFSWGYEGWGNATRQLVRAVDLAEARRGFAPPIFVDVRLSRSVRAVGFREKAFAQLLRHERYRWMPSLGNPVLRNPRAGRRVDSPAAAHQLLDLALDAARQRRRVIFFCSCHALEPGCHRHDVTRHLLRVAGQRGQRIVVEGWPGGQPVGSPLMLKLPAATLEAVRAGRNAIQLPGAAALPTFASLPWGTLVDLQARDEHLLCSVGPAAFQRSQWVLPLFPADQDFDRSTTKLRRRAARARREALLEPARSR